MSKSEVLKRMMEGPVSGGELSGTLGVSRAAVWKMVEQLRAEGFEVSSAPGRGYRLECIPDVLLPELVKAEGWTVRVFDTVDSTNNMAKRLADEGAPDLTAVTAEEQTGGRGRLGRGFVSNKGQGMYLTVILRPDSAAGDITFLTALAAVATRRAILEVCGLDTGIKWTNDLVVGRRKICGILTELSVEGESGKLQYVVVGIGVNCGSRAEDFPTELRDTVTSLRIEGREVPRYKLIDAVLRQLSAMYGGGRFISEPGVYHAEYTEHCVTVGKEVKVVRPGMEKTGVAEGVDDDFKLCVRYVDGTVEHVGSGEVSVRGMYGYV